MSSLDVSIGFQASLAMQIDDVARVIRTDTQILVLFLNASDSGFSRAAPTISRSLLDIAVNAIALPASRDSLQSCLRTLESEILQQNSLAHDDETIAAWPTIVCLGTDALLVGWASGDEVWIVRDGKILHKTSGHSLRAAHPKAPDVLTRGLGAGYARESWEFSEFEFDSRQDTVFIVSRGAARSISAVALLDSLKSDDPAQAIESLVTEAVKRGELFATLCVASY